MLFFMVRITRWAYAISVVAVTCLFCIVALVGTYLQIPLMLWRVVLSALFFVFIIAISLLLSFGFGLIISRAGKWRELGLRYAKHANEDGGMNHMEKAAKYFLKSALFDDDTALINLGLCYADGFGLEKDLVKAARCYKIAAKDSSVARLALGLCYAEGLGVEKDLVKAEDWYKKADGPINAGDYWNPTEVVTWMRKAAEWGNVEIQAQLADYYKSGKYVAKDETEADKWYIKARYAALCRGGSVVTQSG